MSKFLPDTIATRTLLVLVVGLMVSHFISMALYFDDRTCALRLTGGEHTAERIATLAQIVDGASPAERERILQLADSSNLHVEWSPQGTFVDEASGTWQEQVLRRALADHLRDSGFEIFQLRLAESIAAETFPFHADHLAASQASNEIMLTSLQLSDGSWLDIAAWLDAEERFFSLRVALSLAVMLGAVILLSIVVIRRVSEPIATFGRAAEELGTNVDAPPIPEQGPSEVRQAIRAFNKMQDRIRRFVEDRTRMLAAIAHDLGTPITRLRLRAEFVDEPEQQRKMLADLEEMEKMVFASLSFARDDTASEPRSHVDLKSLVERVCDEATDTGADVTIETGSHPVRFVCQPSALRRALANLIDNAVKYGRRATVFLREGEEEIWIEIDDEGPGIPEALLDEAFRPFRRLEGSRSKETGGTGLGLSVARTIVRAHGGDVKLINRSGGGLRAEVRLPRRN